MTHLNLLRDLFNQWVFVYRAVLLAVLLAVAYLFIRENGSSARGKLLSLLWRPWPAAFFFYAAFILTSTLFARAKINPYRNVFNNFGLFIDAGKLNSELVHNILLYIPYTFLFLRAFGPGRPWKAALILSASTSMFVEFSQLLFWLGEFQFSDIFHNTLGGMLGCGLLALANRIERRPPR